MPLAAHNPTDRVEQLILLTDKLSGLMEEENQILADRRPRELSGLQEEKSRLAALYAHEIRAIAKNKSLVSGVEPELTDRLKTFTRTFEEKAAEQKSLLEGARRLTEGAIKAIADEVTKKQPTPSAYTAKANRTASAAHPTSLSLNQLA